MLCLYSFDILIKNFIGSCINSIVIFSFTIDDDPGGYFGELKEFEDVY